MNIMFNLLSASVAVISGADGPAVTTVSGSLPLPAITVAVFAVIFILYVYASKAVRAKKAPAEATQAPQAAAVSAPAPAVYAGPQLIGVEEKDAAVIMAIVSDKTGIPLNRLRFESIKLMED